MDLWIRSQDRRELVKAEHIEAAQFSDDEFAVNVNNYYFGSYKTKERALEILDDIQNRLYTRIMVSAYTEENADLLYSKETQLKVISDTTLYANPINIDTSVYEMPKE